MIQLPVVVLCDDIYIYMTLYSFMVRVISRLIGLT
jgi:hypothetical protein